jgi:hypothetical protein
MGDKLAVILGAVAIMFSCVVYPPPDAVLELIKMGLAGMFGLAMGKSL